MRCDIPCLYFTAGLRRPLWWHGYEVARWLLVSTITTLSTSLKGHCPGQQSTFFGPRSKIAKQHWEQFFFYTFFIIFRGCVLTFYRSLKLLNSLQATLVFGLYLVLLPFSWVISPFRNNDFSCFANLAIRITQLQTEAPPKARMM